MAMTSIPPETSEIIEEIIRLTKDGHLVWEAVQVPRETGAVRVSLASGEVELNRQIGARGATMDVTIRNEDGLRIYDFSIHSSEPDPLFGELDETYGLARRQALRAQDTLARMRKELAGRAR